MSNYSGFVKAGLQLGLASMAIRPVRGLKEIEVGDGEFLPDIIADATIEERHADHLEVTEHPVEQGAAISDHAYKRPAEVSITMAWSNSPGGAGSLIDAGIGMVVANNKTAAQIANVVSTGKAVIDTIGSLLDGSDPGQINAIYNALRKMQALRALFVLYTGKQVYTNMICKSLTTETTSKTANSLVIQMVCQQVIIVSTQTVILKKETQKDASATASQTNAGRQSATPVENPPPGVSV